MLQTPPNPKCGFAGRKRGLEMVGRKRKHGEIGENPAQRVRRRDSEASSDAAGDERASPSSDGSDEMEVDMEIEVGGGDRVFDSDSNADSGSDSESDVDVEMEVGGGLVNPVEVLTIKEKEERRLRTKDTCRFFIPREGFGDEATNLFQELLVTERCQKPREPYVTYPKARVFGAEWYSSCSSRDVGESFPTKSERERANELQARPKNARNLFFTQHWNSIRPRRDESMPYGGTGKVYLVVSNVNNFIAKEKDKKTGKETEKERNVKVYSVFETPEEFTSFFGSLWPGDRHMEEVLLDDTPHKMYFDVERRLGKDAPSLEETTTVFEEDFMPLLVRFFREDLQLDVSRDELLVTYASKEGVKFSVHIVLHSRRGYFLRTGRESQVVCQKFLAFFREQCEARSCACRSSQCDCRVAKRLHEWFFFKENGEPGMMVDESVFGGKQRNMRLPLCCKFARTNKGKHWKDLRVLLPAQDQYDRPLSDYVISLWDAWVHPELYEPIFPSPLFDPQQGRNGKTKQRREGQGEFKDVNDQGKQPQTIEDFLREVAGDRLQLLRDLHKKMKRFPVEWAEYKLRAKALADSVCQAIHPGVSGSERTPSDFHLVQRRVNPEHPRARNNRLCFFGCSHGTHMVDIFILNDLTVVYHCFAGKCPVGKRVILQSPAKISGNMFGIDSDIKFIEAVRPHVVDYATTPCPEGDVPGKMRRLRTRTEMGEHAPSKLTYILHGSMGTGKTHTIGDYLERREREVLAKGEQLRVLVLTFRKILGTNLGKTFDQRNGIKFDHYGQLTKREFFERDKLILQIDSARHLMREERQEGEDYDPTEWKKYQTPKYHVVIWDEVTSGLVHFNSSTMEGREKTTWHTILKVCMDAEDLICADADISLCEQEFISFCRGVRPRNNDEEPQEDPPSFEHLEYHLNRSVAIKTTFFEYGGEAEWANAMLCMLMDGKKIFACSNNLEKLREVEQWIKASILKEIWKEKSDPTNPSPSAFLRETDTDARLISLLQLKDGIKLISSQTCDSEKKCFSEDMGLWTEYSLFMISPTVGAGVDFSMDYFDCAFVYGTRGSLVPRGLNQLRGRVRNLRLKECHCYIQDMLDDDLPTPTLQKCLQEKDTLEKFTRITLREDAIQTRKDCPEALLRVLAYGELEKKMAMKNFQGEWVRQMLMADPNVDYRLGANPNARQNKVYLMQCKLLKGMADKLKTNRVSHQRTLTRADFVELKKNDSNGLLRAEDGESASYILLKGEVLHFYGVSDRTPRKKCEEIIDFTGMQQAAFDRLEYGMRVMFSTPADLEASCRSRHEIENYYLRTATKEERDFVSDYQMRTSRPFPVVVQNVLHLLIHACGGDTSQLTSDVGKALTLHSGLAHQRLESNHLQTELRTILGSSLANVLDLAKALPRKQKKKKKANQSDGGDTDEMESDDDDGIEVGTLLPVARYTEAILYRVLSQMLQSHFGLSLRRKKKKKCPCDEDHKYESTEIVDGKEKRKRRKCVLSGLDENHDSDFAHFLEKCFARSYSYLFPDTLLQEERDHVGGVQTTSPELIFARVERLRQSCKSSLVAFIRTVNTQSGESENAQRNESPNAQGDVKKLKLEDFKLLPFLERGENSGVQSFYEEMQWDPDALLQVLEQEPEEDRQMYEIVMPEAELDTTPSFDILHKVKKRRESWLEMKNRAMRMGSASMILQLQNLDEATEAHLQEGVKNLEKEKERVDRECVAALETE